MLRKLKLSYYILLVIAILYIVIAFIFGVTKTNISDNRIESKDIEPYFVDKSEGSMGDVLTFYFDINKITNNWEVRSGVAIEFEMVHQNIEVYADNELIYESYAKKGPFGRTIGSKIIITEIPHETAELKIVLISPYKNVEAYTPHFKYGVAYELFLENEMEAIAGGIISYIGILLGIILIVIWGISYINVKKDTAMLYFGIFTTILGCWLFNENRLALVIMPDRGAGSLAGYIMLLLMGVPFILYLVEYLQIKEKRGTYALILYCLISGTLGIILHATGIAEFKEVPWISHLTLISVLFYTVWAIVWHIRNFGFDKRAKTTIIGWVVLLLSFSTDLLAYMSDRQDNDILGKMGLLLYIIILGVQGFAETLEIIRESKMVDYYKTQARIDEMTKLYNRRALDDWEKENLGNYENTGVVVVDLNNLKYINDNFGHKKGDEYILWAARSLRDVFDDIGTIYRVGGDEFTVIINKAYIRKLGNRINKLKKLDEEHSLKMKKTGIATGFAICGPDDVKFDIVYKRADEAMYYEKRKMKKDS